MAETRSLAQCFITINGKNVSQAFMDDLAEVVVDTSLSMPDMFTISLRDDALKWVDEALTKIGNIVEISVQTGQERGGKSGELIKGEITALEPDFSVDGDTILLIRGYDKSHRLYRGKLTRTFTNQTDSSIVEKIAGEAGLSAKADPTNITYEYVLQNNQTNMEFLMTRARRLGYHVYVDKETLYFKKGEANLGDGPTLNLGENLRAFTPRWTTSYQADAITVKGWDPKAKQAITSKATPNTQLNQGGMQKTGGETAKGAFGAAEAVVTDRPISSVDEAQALADGLSNDISRDFIQAEGICRGDPSLKAGRQIKVENVGNRFSGTYFATRATHIYNAENYRVRFAISGRQPDTLSHLLKSEPDGQSQGLVRGVVTGLVTNLDDPEAMGRVKVKYAWLGDIESNWVRLAAPSAGNGRGIYYTPEVNDEVLLAFEHGDVHHPYIIGALWNGSDKPPADKADAIGGGKVNQRVIKSRSGHVIILDDTSGSEKIIIRDKADNEIEIDSSGKNLTIKVGNDIIIESQGKFSQKSASEGSIESQSSLSIKSQSNLSIKSMSNLTLEATGQLNIKGNMVSVNGTATTEIKGGIIKLN